MTLDGEMCAYEILSFLESRFRFTPDFTQSRVSNTLRVLTSEGAEFLFPLLASLPQHTLAACYAAQPRPSWEKQLARVVVPFWLVSLVLLIALAFLHTTCGRTGFPTHSRSVATDPVAQPTGGRVFDLKDMHHTTRAVRVERTAAATTRWACNIGYVAMAAAWTLIHVPTLLPFTAHCQRQ